MKKTFYYFLFLACLCLGWASCSKDAEGKATCTYYVGTESIDYNDVQNQIDYDSVIKVTIVSLKLSSYSFTEEGVSNNGLASYAIDICDQKAINTFSQTYTTNPTLDAFRNELFNKNSKFFSEKSISTAEDIDLKPFSINLTLMNYSQQYTLYSIKIDIK